MTTVPSAHSTYYKLFTLSIAIHFHALFAERRVVFRSTIHIINIHCIYSLLHFSFSWKETLTKRELAFGEKWKRGRKESTSWRRKVPTNAAATCHGTRVMCSINDIIFSQKENESSIRVHRERWPRQSRSCMHGLGSAIKLIARGSCFHDIIVISSRRSPA